MDSSTLMIVLLSSLLGFLMVKFYQIRTELHQMQLDKEMDMIYRSVDDVRSNLQKEVERLTTKIENVESTIYSEINDRYRAFSSALNDADRRIDEIVYNNSNKEPTLFDNVS